jgi:hypothetical protein
MLIVLADQANQGSRDEDRPKSDSSLAEEA